MITKTRKQGNSNHVDSTKDFNVPNGVSWSKLVENGIFMNLLEPQKEFYDFEGRYFVICLIIAEGYDKDEILVEFKNRKTKCIFLTFRDIAEDTLTNSKVMAKEELATEKLALWNRSFKTCH